MIALAVVDTNVVVSGLLAHDRDSPTGRILDAVLSGDLRVVLSGELLAEYRAVLLRPAIVVRHGLSEAEVDAVIEGVVVNAAWRACAPATTRGDAHVLALLQAEAAAVLVTGDRALRESVELVGRRALTPGELAAELTG